MKATTILHTLGAAAILHVVVSACRTSNPDASASGEPGAMEACSASGYATHLYPGKPAVELARVQTLARLEHPPTIGDHVYPYVQVASDTSIRDGAVTVDCRLRKIDQVWFVMP